MMGKTGRYLGLVLLMLVAFCSPVLASSMAVVINGQATVRGPQITFAELADISGPDEYRLGLLRSLKLGEAPSPGETITWSAEALGRRLAATGVDLTDISWQVPSSITITTASQLVTVENLTATALATLQQRLGQAVNNGDVTLAVHGELHDIAVPLGALRLNAALPKALHYNAPTLVAVSISTDERLFTTVNVNFTITLFRNVLVANRDLAPHELFTAEDVHMERLDVGHQAGGYLTDPAKVVGFAARRAIPPGTIITEALLEKPLLVQNGNVVLIIARMGALEVSVPGQALQDGKAGQLIRVKNSQSGKVILAQVLDSSTVLAAGSTVTTYTTPLAKTGE